LTDIDDIGKARGLMVGNTSDDAIRLIGSKLSQYEFNCCNIVDSIVLHGAVDASQPLSLTVFTVKLSNGGDALIGPSNMGVLAEALKKQNLRFRQFGNNEGVIQLYACNAGLNPRLVQALANKLGRPIRAANGWVRRVT